MILVDTSVWIDYLSQNILWQSDMLDKFLLKDQVIMCDIIYTEILQGFKKDTDFYLAQSALDNLPFLSFSGKEFALKTAINFRVLKKAGISIRKINDMFIATFCIENKIPLLHNDKDFGFIANKLNLITIKQ
jgi:predicted nucleic acid-binding protein